MLNPPTHNRPFADKRDKVGMDGVPKEIMVSVDNYGMAILIGGENGFYYCLLR